MSSLDSQSGLFEAIAFAARAHRHQCRKDNVTPYVSHVFRVVMVLRHVFEVSDPILLTAAVLHDTIEDTTTDYDDVASAFGSEVAQIVAALTKDKRLPEDQREAHYVAQLGAGGWRVYLCKLADIYDNITDSLRLAPATRQRTLTRSNFYLEALRPGLGRETERAFAIVKKRLHEIEKELANT